MGFYLDMYLGDMLVTMYTKYGKVWTMPTKHLLMLAVDLLEKHWIFFRQMWQRGVQPNLLCYSSIFPSCATLASLENGKEIHGDIINTGVHADVFVGNSFVDIYVKCWVMRMYTKCLTKCLNNVRFDALVTRYVQCGCIVDLLLDMCSVVVLWVFMVVAYA